MLYYISQGEVFVLYGIIVDWQVEVMCLLWFFVFFDIVYEWFWKQFDMVYFFCYLVEEIVWYICLLYYWIFNNQFVVCVCFYQDGEGLQVMVYMQDQFDFFVCIVGFFVCNGYSIVDVKIYIMVYGYVLDSFVVFDILNCDNNCEMVFFIEYELEQCLIQ